MKARITKIGTIETKENGETLVTGWGFEGSNGSSGLGVKDGIIITIGGYTLKELREISRDPSLANASDIEPPNQPMKSLLANLRWFIVVSIVSAILFCAFGFLVIPDGPWWSVCLGWWGVWVAIDRIYPLRDRQP